MIYLLVENSANLFFDFSTNDLIRHRYLLCFLKRSLRTEETYVITN